MPPQFHSWNNLGGYIVPADVRGGTCIDVGGNTGAFSEKYKDVFSVIHVYEPQRECREIIRSRIAGWQHITVFDEAVYGHSNAILRLISHRSHDSGSVALHTDVIVEKEWIESEVVEPAVRTISLEDMLHRIGGRVDYMKVDCETSEFNLLVGKDLSAITYLAVELHWQLGRDNWDILIAHLRRYFKPATDVDLSYRSGNLEALFGSLGKRS